MDGVAGGLRVRLLGPLEVDGADVQSLPGRKSRTLVKVLALARGRPVAADRLIDVLWGEELPANPERDLSVQVSRIRSLLGAARVIRSDAGYALAVDWLDVAALEELGTDARKRLAAGHPAAARTAAAAGLALVRGPFLADEPEGEWARGEREAVERTLAEVRLVAAEAALAAGELAEAATLAAAAFGHDPYDEAALRVLMRAHAAAGRPASALAAYASMRERLAEDLGVGPSAETEALHTAVLTGQPGLRATAPAGPHLPGRARELEELEAALARAGRAAELVVVEGQAGIGKSRLLDTFARSLRSRGVTVLHGHCDELARDLPLQPVADALSAAVHAAGDDGVLGEEATVLSPFLGGGGPTLAAAGRPPGEVVRPLVYAAVVRVLGRLGTPAVLLLDDIHLAGPSTLDWLRFLVRRRHEAHVLVVAARRPEEGGQVPATAALLLRPLDLEATREVVGPALAERFYERTGGHPLFLTELAGGGETESLPDSITASVAERADRAGSAGGLLRVAAVLGPEVDLDLLATVLRRDPLSLLDDLEEGVRRAFLEERGSRFRFVHELVREALTVGTSASRRTVLHREAARALAARPDADQLQLAHHARLGDDTVLAARALVHAGLHAAARYDLDGAERLLGESIALHDTAVARVARGRVRAGREDFVGAEADAGVARALGARAEALELGAWAARYGRRDMAAAIALGEKGAGLATDAATRASCLLAVGLARRGNGELSEAERAFEAAAELEPVAGMGPISSYLALVRVHQGRAQEALRLLQPALEADIALVHGYPVEHVLQMAAHAHGLLGHPHAALQALDELARAVARRGSSLRYGGLEANYRAWILRNLDLAEAAEETERARQEAAIAEVTVQAELDAADAAVRDGRLDTAMELMERVRILAESRPFNNVFRYRQRWAWVQARTELAAGDVDVAEARARVLEAEAMRRGDRRYSTLGRLLVLRARALRGGAVELASAEQVLASLDEVAGMEAWWLTAEAGADLGVAAWQAWAERRAEHLAGRAGPLGERFRAAAARRLSVTAR